MSRCSTTGFELASLRDANVLVGIGGPVVSLVPRSTTGYNLSSLRDVGAGWIGVPVVLFCSVVRWCRVAQPPATSWHPSGMRISGGIGGPVVSLVPRSTTGYNLSSLRDADVTVEDR